MEDEGWRVAEDEGWRVAEDEGWRIVEGEGWWRMRVRDGGKYEFYPQKHTYIHTVLHPSPVL